MRSNGDYRVKRFVASTAFVMTGLLAASTSGAQVGHLPTQSPYVDLEHSQELTFIGGEYHAHRDAANVGPQTFPARTAGLTKRNVLVLDVADLAHRRLANQRHAPHFTRRHTQLRVLAFLRDELRKRSRRTRHLPALAGTQLDVMNLRAERNVD